MFNLPNPGSNPANPFYHRFIEEQRRALQESTPEYRAMMKKYKGSDAEKVFKILDKEGFRMGEQSDTLVRNMLKKHRGNVKKAADQIMKDNPGMFDVNRMMMDDVQINEAYEVTFQFKGSKTKFMSRVKEFQNSGAMTGFSELDKRIEGRPNMVKMTFKSKSDFNKFFSQGVSGGVVKVQENVKLDEKVMTFTFRKTEDAREFESKAFSLANSTDIMMMPGGKTGVEVSTMGPKDDKRLISLAKKMGGRVHKIVEDVQLDEAVKTKIKMTNQGFQVMVFSPKINKFIPQGSPHKTKAEAEKDAKMFEEVTRLKEPRRVQKKKQTRKAKPSMLPAYDARLLRQALVLGKNAFKAGKKREPIKDPNLVKLKGFATGEGKNEVMKQWLKGWDEMNLKDDVQIEEATQHIVHVNVSRTGFRKLEAMIASLNGYRESDYSDGKARFYFDAKKHDSAERKKVAEFIKKTRGAEFSHAMKEDVQLDESFEFEFPTKAIAQKFMREISQEKLGSSIGTSDGKVTTTTNSGRVGEPTMSHMKMARIMKRFSGKLVRTTEGPKMAKIFEEVELDEKRHSKMSAKDHFNKMVAQGKVGRGGRLVTPIDRDRFPNREKEGLEGPFRTKKTGLIYYYDRKAGKYYDPQSDMYLDVNDIMEVVYEEVNLMREEVKTMDQKKAKQVYDKLKKGSEIEVDFGNFISAGGRAITLKVTSGHRIVGKSRVGRIILINPENPRGMKYKLFNRDGKISLAQGDMGTILKDMKIIKEDVDQVDEKEFKAHKMYHPETGEEVDANTKADHLRFSKMGYKHDKPTK